MILRVSKNTCRIGCNHAKDVDLETALDQEEGSELPRKTSKTDNQLKMIIMNHPSITGKALKAKNPKLLANISTRKIQHWLKNPTMV